MPGMTRAGYTPPRAEPPKAPPKGNRTKKKKRRKKRLNTAAVVSMAIFLIAALIGAGTIYIYTETQPYADAFMPGTMLMGYPLAGAPRADGEALLDQIEQDFIAGWRFELACMEETYILTAQDVGLAIDRQATLDPLWAAGRSGGMVSRYADMLRLSREPLIMQPVLTYDMAAADALLESIRQDVEREPVDATVAFAPGSASPFRFTQEETGYALDLTGVREEIERGILTMTASSMTLEPTALEPAAYRAELENAISLRARLTTTLEDDEASAANAAFAASMFSGVTVGAGETLSFNETVGRRTAEGGYVSAPESAYGENVSGVGGGVCQVSTALYRAALLGGIEIAERSGAVRPVPYCDMGQEAAVSDQGLDLVLRNQTDSALFVMTRVYADGEETKLEVTLFGAPLDARYALESLTEETGLIEEPVYVRDSEGAYAVYTDERVPVGKAQMGYAAEVARVTLDENGRAIAREVISQDTYDAVPPAIYVGIQDREDK